MKTVLDAIDSRYSTRYFNKNKNIDKDDLMMIIDAGIKAPSGFNTQPWKFMRITGDRNKIFNSIKQQQAVLDSSEFIVVLYVKPAYLENNSQFFEQFNKMSVDKKKINEYKDAAVIKSKTNYFREQTLFAASQMVLQATAINIDSLIIGGFDEKELLSNLDLDQNMFGISVCLAFGYSERERKERDHRTLDEVFIEKNL